MPYSLPNAFRLGIAAIDEDHENLVDIINWIDASFDTNDLDLVRSQVQAFRDALAAHFSAEEDFMAAKGYPGLDWHRDHHKDCLRIVDAIVDERPRSVERLQDAMLTCFRSIIHDIAHADLKFQEYMEGRPSVA